MEVGIGKAKILPRDHPWLSQDIFCILLRFESTRARREDEYP